jgi:hypothetical protein
MSSALRTVHWSADGLFSSRRRNVPIRIEDALLAAAAARVVSGETVNESSVEEVER